LPKRELLNARMRIKDMKVISKIKNKSYYNGYEQTKIIIEG
jgi:hypothetical protein